MARSTDMGPTGSLYDFSPIRASVSAPSALVAFLTEGCSDLAAMRASLGLWGQANPTADWIGLDLGQPASCGVGRAWLLHTLSAQLARRQMQASQLVVLGRGRPGKFAIDLVLEGALSCVGVVALDIPLTPTVCCETPTETSIRLVLQSTDISESQDGGLIEFLRSADIDTRYMMLPREGGNAEQMAHAAAMFIAELVAKAGWHSVFNRTKEKH